jgi:hypothetical protein
MAEINYRFTEKEWQKLKYNVKDKSTGYTSNIGMLDRFPDLVREVPVLKNKLPAQYNLDHDLIIKYIVIMYSPTSPIHKISDPIERKKAAAIEADFPFISDDRLEEDYESVLYCKYPQVNSMIIAFLKHFKSTKFTIICVGTESLYNKLEMLLNGTPDDHEKKSAEDIEKVRGELFKQIESMEKSLTAHVSEFLTDESPYLKDDLFCFVEKESNKLMLSPELRHAAREAV